MGLSTKSKFLRATKAKGGKQKVERSGGYNNAGLIRDVSLTTVGEALGHGLWLDREFVESVAVAGADADKGIKARFTHPSLSGDGLGSFLGRVTNIYHDGDQAYGDLHFSKAAHRSPDGDLAEYVMDLAEEDPESFGLSIVFTEDQEGMEEFAAAYSNEHGQFESPDPNNTENYLHVRLDTLRAADAVDEPAANPNGLFSRGQETVQEAESLLSFALGLSDQRPATVQLGIDADRAKGFVTRFLSNHNLELNQLSTEQTTAPVDEIETDEAQPVEAEQEQTEELAEAVETEETEDTETDEATEAEPELVAASGRDEAKQFLEAFGERGPVWYAEGLSFEDAQKRQLQELQEENEQLKQRLSAGSQNGETDPIELTATETDRNKPQGLASKINVR